MNLTLLWPIGLLAGVALLLPILLHLLPRRQSTPRSFAALRFIGKHQAPRRQKRLSEWPLLLVRLLLLATLALWLAAAQWIDWPGRGLHWQAVWPGVPQAALDDVDSADRRVWLTPDLPAVADTPRPPVASDAPSLLRELAASLPPRDRLSVLVPDPLSGLDRDALVLSRKVEWQVVAAEATVPPADVPILAIRGDPPGRWLQAALGAWQANPALAATIDQAGPEQAVPAKARTLLWLGDGTAPAWRGSAQAMVRIPTSASDGPTRIDPLSSLSVRPQADGSLQLAGPLDPASTPAVLDPDFPHRLHSLLFQRTAQPGRAPAMSMTPQDDPSLIATVPLDLREMFGVLAALLFALERWLSSGRRLAGARG